MAAPDRYLSDLFFRFSFSRVGRWQSQPSSQDISQYPPTTIEIAEKAARRA
jgi:hypothetical protein